MPVNVPEQRLKVIRPVEETYGQRKDNAVESIAAVAGATMSKGEREQLLKVVRMRARVAKEDINARQAEILAEGQAVLARRFREDDEAFAQIMAEARAYMEQVKAKVEAKAAEMGIPAAFRPTVNTYWFDRGENADPRRRAELQAVLRTRAEAVARAAKVEVDRWSSDLQTQIIAGGLAGDARELLDRLPSAEALMPPLELPELGR
jgi:hypothetical protein